MSNKEMKLAYLISSYPAVSHTFILREIQQLRLLGFTIHTASINTPGQSSSSQTAEEQRESSQTYYIKQAGPLKAFFAFFATLFNYPLALCRSIFFAFFLAGFNPKRILWHLFYIAEAVLLGRWMNQYELKHLHVHFANPAATVALLASKIFPITFSMTVHGPDEFYDVTLNNLTSKIEGALFIFCIGYYAQSQLMRLSNTSQWEKFEITPLGVDPDLFIPKKDQKNSLTCEILSVGRLSASKGFFILIAAFDQLIQTGYNVRLKIVGEGPYKKFLQDEVSKRNLQPHVIFTGALNQNEVLEAAAQSDIFALASFAEGIPVALMEAMSREIPCVATYVNGIPELISSGIDGLLVYPSDVKGMAQALADLIKNPQLRQRLGEAGRKNILEKYNLKMNVRKLSDIFRKRLKS